MSRKYSDDTNIASPVDLEDVATKRLVRAREVKSRSTRRARESHHVVSGRDRDRAREFTQPRPRATRDRRNRRTRRPRRRPRSARGRPISGKPSRGLEYGDRGFGDDVWHVRDAMTSTPHRARRDARRDVDVRARARAHRARANDAVDAASSDDDDDGRDETRDHGGGTTPTGKGNGDVL